MMNNPSNLHVRLRLVRQLSSLAGTRARLPTVGATFPTPTGHQTTRRFSSSVPLTRLEALFFELAKDEEREFLRLRKGGQQDIIAKQLSDVETDVENVHPYDVADCVTPSVTWGDQEAEVDVPTPVDNVCIDAFEVLDDADMYVGETSSCDSVPHVDPGDPFGCDHIDMLQAKARSRYAWVTCETQFEKYVLQAQGRVYFFIERIHDVENIAYNVGFALANRGDNADQGQRTAINSLALFESRKTVVQARSRDDAFRMADLLIEKMISDEKLLRM
ncbi:hypothetical protein QFC22_005457 [Naganishia vaughanmartiniae]|uniref:Uncharacterized protein n=1 Tax=Naganishia vaughanmartiniae TaxID=1424756 RepID=A0ACC2WX74_9TREE|nr:hypothetical protein QFC22_005457 [Naganishia vaughanmartiniae]